MLVVQQDSLLMIAVTSTDPYPSFFSTYAHFLLRHLPLLLLFVTVLTLLQSVLLSSSTATTTWVQDALLGTKQPMFFFVPAMVLFALSSVVAIEAGMLWCLVESAALVAALIKKNRGSVCPPFLCSWLTIDTRHLTGSRTRRGAEEIPCRCPLNDYCLSHYYC